MAIDFHKKQRMRKILFSRAMLLVLIGISALIIFNTWGLYVKERNARAVRREEEREHAELQTQSTFLESEIIRLQTSAGIEEEIRQRFGVAKEGEKVIILLDAPTTTPSDASPGGFWRRLFGWFMRDLPAH